MRQLFDNPVAIVTIILVIVLIFGAPKLPMIARNLGKSLKIAKSELKDIRDDKKDKPADEAPAGTLPAAQAPVEGQVYEPTQYQQAPQAPAAQPAPQPRNDA